MMDTTTSKNRCTFGLLRITLLTLPLDAACPEALSRGGNGCGPLLVGIVSRLYHGTHNYITFFALRFSWGYMFFMVANYAQESYAMETLTGSRELFEKAIAEKRICVVRKQKT